MKKKVKVKNEIIRFAAYANRYDFGHILTIEYSNGDFQRHSIPMALHKKFCSYIEKYVEIHSGMKRISGRPRKQP